MSEDPATIPPATLAIARDLVLTGRRNTGIALTDRLEHYLSLTIARFLRQAITGDRLTVRITRAMDENAGPSVLRALADECLIVCAFFEDRLRHHGGTIRHYVGLGQVAYESAHLVEQAYGFVHMRDVVHHGIARRNDPRLIGGTPAGASGRAPDGSTDSRIGLVASPAPIRHTLDAARAGSGLARAELERQGVVIFSRERPHVLIWNR